jgi:hypothetical protein
LDGFAFFQEFVFRLENIWIENLNPEKIEVNGLSMTIAQSNSGASIKNKTMLQDAQGRPEGLLGRGQDIGSGPDQIHAGISFSGKRGIERAPSRTCQKFHDLAVNVPAGARLSALRS